MALGSREILLVIRARDEASRSLRFLSGNLARIDKDAAAAASAMLARGTALFSLGAGLTSAGVALGAALASATKLAEEYDLAARMTLTQTDSVIVSLDKLKSMAIQTGRQIPVPLMELQGALYDIFSTIDVSVPEAQLLLDSFAKEAVTGQADIRRAAMTTIAILNAFQIPIQDITRLQDVQFQAVRKGAMTYEELSNNIGKAIPAAVQAGQQFETLAGMMSFLTRGGLNVSMSATSAARALEAMSHPKTVARLEEMGINVKDAQGNFRPMVDIFRQLNSQLEGMGDAQRNEVIQDLLKGGGNRIQARRFWIRALSDFDELEKHVDWMINSEGAFEDAYQTMLEAPAMKVELLKNRFAALRIEIGERLLPVKMWLVDQALKLLDVWDRLDPKTKDLVVRVAALTAAFLAVAGVITMVSGAMLLIRAAFMMIGGTVSSWIGMLAAPFKWLLGVLGSVAGRAGLGAVLKAAGPVGIALSALITIGTLVVKNWDAIKAAAERLWSNISSAWNRFVTWVQSDIAPIFKGFADGVRNAWENVTQSVGQAWENFKEGWNRAVDNIGRAWDRFLAKFEPAREAVRDTFGYLQERWEYIKPGLTDFFNTLGDIAERIGNVLGPAIEGLGTFLGELADTISQFVGPVIEGLGDILAGIVEDIGLAIETAVALLTGDWDTVKENMRQLGRSTATGFKNAFNTVFDGWEIAWDDLKRKITEWWNGTKEDILEKWEELKEEIPRKIDEIKTAVGEKMQELGEDLKRRWEAIKVAILVIIDNLPYLIGFALGRAVDAVADWFRGIGLQIFIEIQRLFANVASAIAVRLSGILTQIGTWTGQIVAWFTGLPNRIWEALASLGDHVQRRFDEMTDISWASIVAAGLNILREVLTWPNRIASALIALPGILRDKALEAGRGFIDGLGPDQIAIMRVMGEWMWRIIDAIAFLPQKLFLWGIQTMARFIAGLNQHVSRLSMIPLEWSARIVLGLINLPGQLFRRGFDSFWEFVRGLLNNPDAAGNATKQSADRAYMATAMLPGNLGSRAWDAIRRFAGGLDSNTPRNTMSYTANKVKSATYGLAGELYSRARNAMSRFVSGLKALQGYAASAAGYIASQVRYRVSSGLYGFWSAGYNAIMSLARGIYSGASAAISAAAYVASRAIAAARSILRIGSPSKVFLEIGNNLPESMAKGMRDGIPELMRASTDMANTVATAQFQAQRDYSFNPASLGMPTPPVQPGESTQPVTVNVYTEEIDPQKHAQELGFEIAARSGL